MKYKLKELFDLQMGKTPSRNNSEYWNTKDYKWISIADLSQAEKYISDTKEYLSDSAVKESGIKVIPANTVIMSFKLSIGKTAITAEDMYSNEAIMAFHDKHVIELLPEYIYYMFKYKNWDQGSNKAVMGKTLNKATLSNVEIEICPVEKQKEIVNVLDKMMSILSDRENEAELLDELIKSRFVEMFGDFESNPCGWRESTLGDECYYIKDGPHKSPSYIEDDNGIPFISTRNIVNGAGIDWSTAKYISEVDYLQCIKKCHPQKGDILYSKGGTTGIAKLVDTDRRFANWVHVAVLKFGRQLDGRFLECMLNMDYCYNQSQRLTKGIANRDFVLSAIAQVKIFVPPVELQCQYTAFVRTIDKSEFEVSRWTI